MSVGTTQLSSDLDFMLGHYSVTLTGVVPTTMATATWAASKQSSRILGTTIAGRPLRVGAESTRWTYLL